VTNKTNESSEVENGTGNDVMENDVVLSGKIDTEHGLSAKKDKIILK